MRHLLIIIASILFAACITIPAIADRSAGSINLTANPAAIRADGKSMTTITAQVRDREGRLVPNNTEIRFTTSIGAIEESAFTTGGVARVRLVSSELPGTAVVTASWVEGQSVAQITVFFTETDIDVSGPEYISVDAEYVAFSSDHHILDAIGDVKVRYRSLDLKAHEVQIDLQKNRIIARWQGRDTPVEIHTPSETIEGSMFSFDMLGARGLLLSVADGQILSVDISEPFPKILESETPHMPEEFDTTDLFDSAIFIRASHATIFPNQKVQFKKATLFIDGRRLFTLPFYKMSLTGMPIEGDQYIGYSTGGLTLNLPFYYSLTPYSSGAALVRHGSSTGWGQYGQRPGWYVDLRQKYSTDRSEGMFVLNQVTRDDWGAYFTHSQSLDSRTRAFLYLDYPAHESLYGSVNLNRSFNQFNLGLNLYGSHYPEGGQDSIAGDINIQTNSKKIGKLPLRYTLSGRLSQSQTYWKPVVFEDEEPVETIVSSNYSHRLDARIHTDPLNLAENVSIRSSFGTGYVWDDIGTTGLSMLGNAALNWRISQHNNFQLNYRFSERPVSSLYQRPRTPEEEQQRIQVPGNRRQTLSAHLRLGDGNRWRASLFGVRGLDYDSMNLFADFNYKLDRNWRCGVRATLSDFGQVSYNDLELSLARNIGRNELIAVWSKSQKRVMFELGSSRF